MSLKIEPQQTALLVIDMQNDWVDAKGISAKHGSNLWKNVRDNGVTKNISKIIVASRRLQIPIFFVRVAYRKDQKDLGEMPITDEYLEFLSEHGRQPKSIRSRSSARADELGKNLEECKTTKH